MTAGLDPLTPDQLEKIKPYWLQIVDNISTMPVEDAGEILVFANRMKNDADFARHWVSITQKLFNLEDKDDSNTLERGEFDRFCMTTSAALMTP